MQFKVTKLAILPVPGSLLVLMPIREKEGCTLRASMPTVQADRSIGTRPGDEKWSQIADLDTNGTINVVDVAMAAKDFGKTF